MRGPFPTCTVSSTTPVQTPGSLEPCDYAAYVYDGDSAHCSNLDCATVCPVPTGFDVGDAVVSCGLMTNVFTINDQDAGETIPNLLVCRHACT